MPLETLGNNERLNIKDFVDTPEMVHEELLFDPERDLTKEDWEIMLHNWGYADVRNLEQHLRMAAHLQQLKPSDIFCTPQNIEDMKKRFRDNKNRAIRNPFFVGTFSSEAASLRILDPKNCKDLLNSDEWMELRNETLENLRTRSHIHDVLPDVVDFTESLASLKIYAPDANNSVEEDDWSIMVEWLQSFRGEFGPSRRFARLVASMRILRPQKKEEIATIFGCSQEAIIGKLRGARRWIYAPMISQAREKFAEYAANLYIITAPEIEIDEAGFHILRGKKVEHDKVNPLPEIRKF